MAAHNSWELQLQRNVALTLLPSRDFLTLAAYANIHENKSPSGTAAHTLTLELWRQKQVDLYTFEAGQLGLSSKLQASKSYIVRIYLKISIIIIMKISLGPVRWLSG